MAQDIGIDLGTANIVIAVNGKGVVLNEPSVIAVNKRTNKIVAIGKKAYRMVGKAPEYISVIRPLSCGVISDDEMTQCLIREFVHKASGHRLVKPRIVICVPSFITDVESRAVVEAAMNAGSRKVYLQLLSLYRLPTYCLDYNVHSSSPTKLFHYVFQSCENNRYKHLQHNSFACSGYHTHKSLFRIQNHVTSAHWLHYNYK